MSRTLTFELSEEAYIKLLQQGEATGTSPAHLAALSLERQFGINGPPRTEAEKQEARQRFERHFGEVDLGHATGSDNESIDADLAREYADTHEGA